MIPRRKRTHPTPTPDRKIYTAVFSSLADAQVVAGTLGQIKGEEEHEARGAGGDEGEEGGQQQGKAAAAEFPPPLALDRALSLLDKAAAASDRLRREQSENARRSLSNAEESQAAAAAASAKLAARAAAVRVLQAGDLVLLQPRGAQGSASAAASSWGPVTVGENKYALSPDCADLVKDFVRVEGGAGLRLGRVVMVVNEVLHVANAGEQ